jgi:hypothetical protein
LLEAIFPNKCSHEFSWPRTTSDGGMHYQTCLICGVEYEYDWQRMKRVRRIDTAETISRPANRPRRQWTSRARRVKFITPVEYRVSESDTWHSGITQNISQSGLLFLGEQRLAIDTRVELKFEMPREVLGRDGRRVLAVGCVVRHQIEPQDSAFIAVNIWNYEIPDIESKVKTEAAGK